MSYASIDLFRTGRREEGKALARVLDGKTFMGFRVITAIAGGEYQVSLEGESIDLTEKELTDMALGVLAGELAKRVPSPDPIAE